MRTRWLVFALLVGVLAFVAAGCGGGDDGGGRRGQRGRLRRRSRSWRIWAGEEQESFEAVIDGFGELYPNVDVTYTSGGDNLVTAPLDRGRGRQPARHRGCRPARH